MTLRTIITSIAIVLAFKPAPAQLVQTDEFDFWEDQTTHSFTTSGITFQGAYTCTSDKTLRCGNCSSGTGAASVVMKVNANCDTVLLTFLLGWTGGNSVVTVDGIGMGTINAFGSCTWDSLLLVNAGTVTADSAVTVIVRDTILGCSGDIQIARMRAFSSGGLSTGIEQESFLGKPHLSITPNPASGPILVSIEGLALPVDHLIIFDQVGRPVYTTHWPGVNRRNAIIDPGIMAPGMYLISIVTSKGVLTNQFVWTTR